ncbi:uncharacterized protein LOC133198570 [Saccostrea echinata]|uniref:uncharacterized protein LOC133198570 n=1 Tax=Saccostrea echinata TaxID=191078 RepID=UPI002A82BB9F|nr:uncharacterized protein LOC133198570 [Saccostrea echinata]
MRGVMIFQRTLCVFVLVCVESVCGREFVMNSKTCKQSTGGLVGCDWIGLGIYVADPQYMMDQDTIVFRRFFDGGLIEMNDLQSLRVLEIQSGDVACDAVRVQEKVRVYIRGKLCDKSSTMHSSSPSFSSAVGSSGSSPPSSSLSENTTFTSLTVTFETTSNSFPHISILWQTMNEFKIALIIISGKCLNV